jgi:DNA-directed RNA polymerase subunit RPC12/RpoP
MWQCSNCGEEVGNDFEICWNCETEKGDSIAIEEGPESWECDACGAEVASADFICPTCGADISEIAGPQIFCPKCSARVDDDAEYCSSCAARISATDIMNCPNCGKSVDAEAKFCKYCAADLQRTNVQSLSNIPDDAIAGNLASRQQAQTSTSANLVFFGIVLAVVSAAAYLWGVNYAGNFSNAMAAGLGNLVGQRNQTYDVAVMAMQFGPFGFFTGVILFVAGLVLKYR